LRFQLASWRNERHADFHARTATHAAVASQPLTTYTGKLALCPCAGVRIDRHDARQQHIHTYAHSVDEHAAYRSGDLTLRAWNDHPS
jgi:hypothetical protein